MENYKMASSIENQNFNSVNNVTDEIQRNEIFNFTNFDAFPLNNCRNDTKNYMETEKFPNFYTNLTESNDFFQNKILVLSPQNDLNINKGNYEQKLKEDNEKFNFFIPLEQNNQVTHGSHIRNGEMPPPESKIQKKVNYLNHKFVISETEDISLDKLLAINQPSNNIDTTFTNLQTKIQENEQKCFRSVPRQGESILKTSENQTKKFITNDDHKIRPIAPKLLPNIIRTNPVIQKRKISETENNFIEQQQQQQQKNSLHGKVIPISQVDDKKNVQKITAATNINRQFIKIPISALPNIEKGDNNKLESKNGIDNGSKALSNSFVLNIVNMVANNPEITQKSEINHSQITGDKNSIIQTNDNKNVGNTDSGSVAILNDRKSVVYHNRQTNTKTIYRIVNPEDVNLQRTDSGQINKTITLKKNLVHRSGPGRPKGVRRKRIIPNSNQRVLTQPTARTRAGRLSRPPQHIQNYFKTNGKFTKNLEETPKENTNLINSNILYDNIETDNLKNIPIVKKERKIPSQYKCKKCNKIYLGYSRMTRHLESFPDHGDISELFQMKIKNMQSYDDTLFQYLIKKIRKTPLENRARIFFDEISNLTKRIQILIPKLVTENIGCPTEFIDEEMMKVLNIPIGKYLIDMSVLDDDVNLEMPPVQIIPTQLHDNVNHMVHVHSQQPQQPQQQHQHHHNNTDNHHLQQQQQQQHLQQHHHNQNQHALQHQHSLVNDHLSSSQRIEYNLNISLDSNDGDKTNLSDDSFLQSVDEFVKERWKNLSEEELQNAANNVPVVPNFISVNDTQIKDHLHHHPQPPPILDLSLDYLLN